MLKNRPWEPHHHPFTSFSIEQDLADSLRSEAAYRDHGKNARSLVRSQALTLVLTALKAGTELKPHRAPTDATVLVLQGELAFRIHGSEPPQETRLATHDGAVFTADVEHSVRAISDCLFFLAIGGKVDR